LIAAARNNADTQAARSAILALGQFKDARAVAVLMNALNLSTREQDETIASSLGRIGGTAVPPLFAELKSGGPVARVHVLDALGWIDDPLAPSLCEE
jgi:HEAT repeat protein